MNTHDFLWRILPPETAGLHYVGHAIHKDHGVRHQSFRSIARLQQWLEYWDNKQFDCYFAVAGFEAEIVHEPGENGFWKRHRRSKANKPWLMNFHGDIDTKLTHAIARYAHPEEAAHDIVRFCHAHNLPQPLWIMSGGGLHVYWHLRALLAMDEWIVLATGLKHAMLDFGVDVGKERAADPCSILRVPGLHHWKTGNIVQVGGVVEDLDVALFEQFRTKGLEHHGNRTAKSYQLDLRASPIARAMASGILDAPSSMALIGHRCGQLEHYAGSPGSFGETFSRGVAGLARECGPAGWTEYLGWLHPDYHGLAKQKADGWHGSATTCAYFKDHSPRPEICDTCPVKGITSPILIGRGDFDWPEEKPRAAAPAPEPQAAGDSERGDQGLNGFPSLEGTRWAIRDGKIIMPSETKQGNDNSPLVSEHLLYLEGVYESESTGLASYTIKHKLPSAEGFATINMPADYINDNRFVAALSLNHAVPRNTPLLREYLQDQAGEFNRKNGPVRPTRYEQCGFKIAGKDRKFVHGPALWVPGAQPIAAVTADELGARIREGLMPQPGGSAHEFVSILNQLFPTDNYPAWFGVCAGYASIFMPFFDPYAGGCMLNYTGPTGGGKTMIAAAGVTIWGKLHALLIKHHDTPASMGISLAVAGNIPMLFDEIHHLTSDPFIGLQKFRGFSDLYNAGTDKHRALQFGTGLRHQMQRWCMILFGTSNQGVIDILESGTQVQDGIAAAMRAIEFSMQPQEFEFVHGQNWKNALDDNAGHCGAAFLQLLMQPGVLKEIERNLQANKETIWKASGFASEQRYRIYVLAAIATVFDLLQAHGLVPQALDKAAMLQWAIDRIRARSPLPMDYKPSFYAARGALNEFLTQNIQNTLRVQFAYKHGMGQLPIGQKPVKLMIRVEIATGRAYVAAQDFKRWLIKAGHPYGDTMAALTEVGVIVNDRKWLTLGAGTEYSSTQVPCVEFNLAHPAADGILRPVEGSARADVDDARGARV